jgi:hypothetical protein
MMGWEHTEANMATPPNLDQLLATSLGYVRAKFAFEEAIRTARKSGTSDSEIAHIIGYSVPMLEAVAGRERPQSRDVYGP